MHSSAVLLQQNLGENRRGLAYRHTSTELKRTPSTRPGVQYRPYVTTKQASNDEAAGAAAHFARAPAPRPRYVPLHPS